MYSQYHNYHHLLSDWWVVNFMPAYLHYDKLFGFWISTNSERSLYEIEDQETAFYLYRKLEPEHHAYWDKFINSFTRKHG